MARLAIHVPPRLIRSRHEWVKPAFDAGGSGCFAEMQVAGDHGAVQSWQWKNLIGDLDRPSGCLHILRYNVLSTVQEMADDPQPKKIPLIFFRTLTGSEPVREWLKELPEEERQAIGKDLLRAQWRWPTGMPLCRAIGSGLWEIRTDLPTKRTARVLLCVYREHLVALHGFIKKTRAMPDQDLALARKRKKELEQ